MYHANSEVQTAIDFCKTLVESVPLKNNRKQWINCPEIKEKIVNKYRSVSNEISEFKFCSEIGISQGNLASWLKNIKNPPESDEKKQIVSSVQEFTGPSAPAINVVSSNEPIKKSVTPTSIPVLNRNNEGGRTTVDRHVVAQNPSIRTKTIVGTTETGDIVIKLIQTKIIKRGTPEYERFCSSISVPSDFFT